jgi:hypothetical protein
LGPRTDPAGFDQVIEQLTDGSQVLLHGRLGGVCTELLDVCGDGNRLDIIQTKAVILAPIEEQPYRARIRHPGIMENAPSTAMLDASAKRAQITGINAPEQPTTHQRRLHGAGHGRHEDADVTEC